MTHERMFACRWTHRLKCIIIHFILCIFGVGIILGFAIGRITCLKPTITVSSDTIRPMTKTISAEALPPVEHTTDTTMKTVSEDISTQHYDCPLDNGLQEYIYNLCEENDLPMSLIIAVIAKESSFRPYVISGSGDYGLMQINTINHAWLSEKYGVSDFLDPYQNVFCGITLVAEHYTKYKDANMALMAYNLGVTGARRLWNKGVYSTPYSNAVIKIMEEYDGIQ